METQRSAEALLPRNALREHIENRFLREPAQVPHSRLLITSRITLAVIGVLWGVPWTEAAGKAAVIFPDSVTDGFYKTFAAGIVMTVGADGLWVMLQNGKRLIKGLPTLPTFRDKLQFFAKWFCTTILALIACIPSVYASTTYNTGSAKFLSVLTFLGNLGYGFYAYSVLIDQIAAVIARPRSVASADKIAQEQTKKKLLASIDVLLNSKAHQLIPNQINTADEVIDYILNSVQSDAEARRNLCKNSLQMIISLIIAFGAATVALFLTKDALLSTITDSRVGAYILAGLVTIPDLVIGFISSYDLSGRMYDRLFQNRKFDHFLSVIAPVAGIIIPIVSFILALTAPTAAAYITQTTVARDSGEALAWTATAAMILARFVFANFTLNRVGSLATTLILEKIQSDKKPLIEQRRKLEDLREAVAGSSLVLFTATGLSADGLTLAAEAV